MIQDRSLGLVDPSYFHLELKIVNPELHSEKDQYVVSSRL